MAQETPQSIAKPKTRTNVRQSKFGCFTCRLRRVKCDEAKPICSRCRKSRRKCQGYPIGAPSNSQARRDVTVASFSLDELGRTISYSASLERNQDKSRWQALACTALAEGFVGMRTGPDVAFWTRLIPQLTHSMPCVKEAAAALGASYEHQMLRRRSSASKFSALKQITAAVKRLQDDVVLLPSGPVPVFVACVLLACAETLGHRNTDALLHLRGAFAAMSLGQVPAAKGLIPWNDETSYTFQKFDIQIASYSSGGTPPMWQSDNIEDLQDLKSRPVTIETAEKALIRYLHTCYRFTSQAAEYRYRVKATQRSCLMMEQDRHIANLTSWLSWYRRGCSSSNLESESDRLKGHVFQAQCLSALIWVSTILNPYETAYDQYAVQFQEIVEHVEQALAVNKGPSSLPIFITGIGMIQPLWLTAINYRHSKWRSKAISLLRRCGREGPWCNYVEAASTEAFVRAEEGAYLASVRRRSQTAEMPFEISPEDLSEKDRMSGCSLLEVLESGDGSKKAVVQLTKCRDMETLLANANPDDTSNWVIWYETCELVCD
ncbi:hypothetical protein PV11_09453 [Exophiala sideris]|uniref:Zn(2)-C6 fungal-type domain-containing protein n=1 Tax=Exophiala sideris TaxID=1016849 RepID=A0A0D1YA32_9EURO|nr:hypothetical protein PV11_09453 [Exophiala sideris]